MLSDWFTAAIGGLLIGTASALLLLTHGRIAGISGIVGGVVQNATPDRAWRYAFLGGLLVAGLSVALLHPSAIGASVRSPVTLAVAGLLVGFGTRLGSGCTSGHGVCGLSRRSTRSVVAVAVFMTAGALTAVLARVLS